MKRFIIIPAVVSVLLLGAFFFLQLTTSLFREDPASLLQEADGSYQAGETASSVDKRQRAFNRALELYAALEDQYHPTMGNGKLYYNMSNTFYQLNAYPWALLDGYRAKALRPRDEKVEASINNALKKLNLKAESSAEPFSAALVAPVKLSLPEKINLFCWLTAAAFFFFSFYIWYGRIFLKVLGAVATCLAALFLLNLGYSYYIAPIEGVLIRSSLLYRDAGKQYAPVSETPVPSGQKIEVLETADQGRWLKVQAPGGPVGFVPAENLRLI